MLRPCSLFFVTLLSISPFCPTADHILFSRFAPSAARLFISNADGSAERALTQPGALDYNPAWSATGNWIVVTSERAGSAGLYRIHPDGTGLDRLVPVRPFVLIISPVLLMLKGAVAKRLWTKTDIEKARKVKGTLQPGPKGKKSTN